MSTEFDKKKFRMQPEGGPAFINNLTSTARVSILSFQPNSATKPRRFCATIKRFEKIKTI